MKKRVEVKTVVFIDGKPTNSFAELGSAMITGLESDLTYFFAEYSTKEIVVKMIHDFGDTAELLRHLNSRIKSNEFDWDDLIDLCNEILEVGNRIGGRVPVSNSYLAAEIVQLDESPFD